MKGTALWMCVVLCGCGRAVATGEGAPGNGPAKRVVTSLEATDSGASVAGYELSLVERDGACSLRFSGRSSGERGLSVKPPCHFLRRDAARPQLFSYPEVQVEAVAIVVGTPAGPAARKAWKLPPEAVCGEETQGVMVKRGAVVVTRAVHRGGVVCKDKGADEKEFWAFAHDE